jgi:glucose/arabinose dehydrogenase
MLRTRAGLVRVGSWISTAAILAACACTGGNAGSNATTAAKTSCDTTLTLPAGFCATVFADSIGHARHIAVAANGDVYVNTTPARNRAGKPPTAGGVIVALRDTAHTGHASVIARFGSDGSADHTGGTGIAVYGGYVYAEDGARIVRYKLRSGDLVPDSAGEVMLSAMPLEGDHTMHPFIIDSSGTLYVDMGSATNSCQAKNRTLESPGHKPCTELATRAGIWKYDANKPGQVFSTNARFATGLRNAEGYAINPADGQLYATQHGRDQLGENWPKHYTMEQSAELPAEQVVRVTKGGDYGWPYCYFDGMQGKLMLAPEYGGDGKTVGLCAKKIAPIGWYPGHWAPDDMHFYRGTQFPDHYRGGAFIAFHGSWNRAPLPQGGYNITFVPWSAHPDSTHETFVDGFAGAVKQPDKADHRPVGLAEGPDGSLYITDDQNGRVWKVTYTAPATGGQ